jgi:tetratricopeptide (TPR) repeat protein
VGRKPARTGKYIYLSIASLIFLSLVGCATTERTKERVELSTSSSGVNERALPGTASSRTKERVEIDTAISGTTKEEEKRKGELTINQYLLRGQKLLARGDYEGSLRENQRVLSLSPNVPPGDEALFNTGLIYAHPGNPQKDFTKSLSIFKKLMKDHPQSPWAEQAKIWVEVLQENERLNQTIQKLNQVIEKSKQVDIEIEEKKKEKAR